jgi:steroid 5-alpha reductase family enzyme
MSYPRQLALLALLMVIAMFGAWLWQRRRRNAGIVDVVWAAGLGIAALLMGATGSGGVIPRALLACMGGAWALRLAWHLWRRVRHESEDGRYRQLRAHWHGDQRKFLAFFQMQAALVVVFALPFMAVAANPRDTWSAWCLLAIAIWLISVVGETMADRQLAHFRANPENHGKTCQSGLWRYSRHPNYFFEWLHWFAYVALAVGSPIGWLAWSGPLVMYVFLRWISGVPFTEAQALRSRGDEYRDYQRRTPMLFPWFPSAPSSSQGAPHERVHRRAG